MTDKPLHVRVAEALGWDTSPDLHHRDEASEGCSACTRCGAVMGWNEPLPALCVPRYDTDWSATGPLIERFGLSVRLSANPYRPSEPWTAWAGASDMGESPVAHGATPLLALCHLVLALHAAGKLDGERR